MQVLTVIYENGNNEITNFAEKMSTQAFFNILKSKPVDTIVVGEIDSDGKVIWEKQFSSVTVMPSSFGKPS